MGGLQAVSEHRVLLASDVDCVVLVLVLHHLIRPRHKIPEMHALHHVAQTHGYMTVGLGQCVWYDFVGGVEEWLEVVSWSPSVWRHNPLGQGFP